MTLRTPRRRISPRARKRVRVIRDFFRRALGNTQQDIKINSSIVNVTDLKHRRVDIEQDVNGSSESCLESSCQRSSCSGCSECAHAPMTSRAPLTSRAARRASTATTVLYPPPQAPLRLSDESDYASAEFRADAPYLPQPTAPPPPPDVNDTFHSQLSKQRKKKTKPSVDKVNIDTDYDSLVQRRAQSALDTVMAAYSSKSRRSMESERAAPAPRRERRRRRGAAPGASPPPPLAPLDDHLYEGHRTRRKPAASPAKRYDTDKQRYDEYEKRYDNEYERLHKNKIHKKRKETWEKMPIDEDYIADIIRKQYNPVKVFGIKESDMSQISVPVCRDHVFPPTRDVLVEGSELCSCCVDEPAPAPAPATAPATARARRGCECRARSAAALRSRRARHYLDDYNDAALYDIVPVKETSSPKSRRKFIEDDLLPFDRYKEVPPSPRTQRPRLNLKAQIHADYEDYLNFNLPREQHISRKHRKRREITETNTESDITSLAIKQHRKMKSKLLKRPAKVQTSVDLAAEVTDNSSAPCANDNNVANGQQQAAPDKTDRALNEIKDILQSFLQEMKKESSTLQTEKVSKCNEVNDMTMDTSVGANLTGPGAGPGTGSGAGSGAVPGAGPGAGPGATGAYTVAHCNVPPGFMSLTNPYCYNPMSVLPMCPHSFPSQGPIPVTPSASCPCHPCPPTTDLPATTQDLNEGKKNKSSTEFPKNNETEELIKEIYKFVTLKPKKVIKETKKREVRKVLTSRSVGSSHQQQDAAVATSALQCHSRSCEAIGSRPRLAPPASYTATRSDTVLEKLNLDVTHSETETSGDSLYKLARQKSKDSRLRRMLQSMGLKKKKKPEYAAECSFSTEQSYQPPPPPQPPPFRQEVFDYAVHTQYHAGYTPPDRHWSQNAYYPPESPRLHDHRQPYPPRSPPPPPRDHRPYYDAPPSPRADRRRLYHYPPGSPPPGSYTPHRLHDQPIPEYEQYGGHHSYTSYGAYHTPPAAPLCLQEIEVRSTGTQSERKINAKRSFFKKLARRPVTDSSESPGPAQARAQPPPRAPPQRPGGRAPPAPQNVTEPSSSSNPLVNSWKRFQEKVKADLEEDPLMHGYKMRQKMGVEDQNGALGKHFIKKMLYKKNPFSRNNLVIRTLLGNDPSSFGDPNVKLRPRLFF